MKKRSMVTLFLLCATGASSSPSHTVQDAIALQSAQALIQTGLMPLPSLIFSPDSVFPYVLDIEAKTLLMIKSQQQLDMKRALFEQARRQRELLGSSVFGIFETPQSRQQSAEDRMIQRQIDEEALSVAQIQHGAHRQDPMMNASQPAQGGSNQSAVDLVKRLLREETADDEVKSDR